MGGGECEWGGSGGGQGGHCGSAGHRWCTATGGSAGVAIGLGWLPSVSWNGPAAEGLWEGCSCVQDEQCRAVASKQLAFWAHCLWLGTPGPTTSKCEATFHTYRPDRCGPCILNMGPQPWSGHEHPACPPGPRQANVEPTAHPWEAAQKQGGCGALHPASQPDLPLPPTSAQLTATAQHQARPPPPPS